MVLDSRKVFGSSSEAEGSLYQIRGFPKAGVRRIVPFPRTCVNQAVGLYNQEKMVQVENQSVRLSVQESGEDRQCIILYRLDRNLRVTNEPSLAADERT